MLSRSGTPLASEQTTVWLGKAKAEIETDLEVTHISEHQVGGEEEF
ncbi:MAG: hypothetical protein JSW12_22185 [Deltaproteobacteria bacterium]|nr:MAG: hypothetical protein JSW12_22185 [Deltaproteobacteria bacterium]